jgi:putative membrane protein
MSYFAFSAARRLLAPRTDPGTVDGALGTALLAAVIGTWMDTVIDPLTLLGRYWFLGDLYHYDPPGAHFGVPLSNYAGWFVTIGAIALANQGLDRLLGRLQVPLRRGPVLPLEPLWGVGCCLGVFAFQLAINLALLAGGRTPAGTPLGAVLASGLVSSGLIAALVAVRLGPGLSSHPSASRRGPGGDPGSPSRSPRPPAR